MKIICKLLLLIACIALISGCEKKNAISGDWFLSVRETADVLRTNNPNVDFKQLQTHVINNTLKSQLSYHIQVADNMFSLHSYTDKVVTCSMILDKKFDEWIEYNCGADGSAKARINPDDNKSMSIIHVVDDRSYNFFYTKIKPQIDGTWRVSGWLDQDDVTPFLVTEIENPLDILAFSVLKEQLDSIGMAEIEFLNSKVAFAIDGETFEGEFLKNGIFEFSNTNRTEIKGVLANDTLYLDIDGDVFIYRRK